jgi:hypothetical protein
MDDGESLLPSFTPSNVPSLAVEVPLVPVINVSDPPLFNPPSFPLVEVVHVVKLNVTLFPEYFPQVGPRMEILTIPRGYPSPPLNFFPTLSNSSFLKPALNYVYHIHPRHKINEDRAIVGGLAFEKSQGTQIGWKSHLSLAQIQAKKRHSQW